MLSVGTFAAASPASGLDCHGQKRAFASKICGALSSWWSLAAHVKEKNQVCSEWRAWVHASKSTRSLEVPCLMRLFKLTRDVARPISEQFPQCSAASRASLQGAAVVLWCGRAPLCHAATAQWRPSRSEGPSCIKPCWLGHVPCGTVPWTAFVCGRGL